MIDLLLVILQPMTNYRNINKFLKTSIYVIIILGIFTCDDLFEYSVYDTDVKNTKKNTTSKKLLEI
jgi:hypothetical protein